MASADIGDVDTPSLVAAEHCHICVGTALPAATAVVARSIERTIPPHREAGPATYVSLHDTPPPRTLA